VSWRWSFPLSFSFEPQERLETGAAIHADFSRVTGGSVALKAVALVASGFFPATVFRHREATGRYTAFFFFSVGFSSADLPFFS